MEKFKDKVIVITGGNSGIGYATAKEFKAEGGKVIITGRRQDALNKAAQELGVTGILSDQTNLQHIDNLVAAIKTGYGKADVLFINAGVASFAPLGFISEEQFDAMLNVNFKGSFFMLQKFLPVLNDGASVIILTSNATALAMENSSVYSAGKAALAQVAKVAAKELAPRRIRVNTVAPGPTDTEMLDKFGVDEATLSGMKTQMAARVPLAKLGVPEDVARMVVYLADNAASSFITGAEFFIDGGMAL